MIKVNNVTKIYGSGETACKALDNVSLNIGSSDIAAIIGPSGSGKSTLINVMSTLDLPTDGEILFDSEKISSMKEAKKSDFRLKNFGFVFQDFYLMSTLNVKENIILPMNYKSKDYDNALFEELVNKCGIGNKLLNYPHELSSGEQQRVAICRALLMKPKVIFADEPTGNLDSYNSKIVFDLLISYAKSNNSCLVYVTHEEKYASLADYKIEVLDGKCTNISNDTGGENA